MSADNVWDRVALNMTAPMELTRQVLPSMLVRKRGMVVNISSFAALAVMPTIATYCATKAGISHFTAAVQRELRGSNVRIMTVRLGEVAGTELVEGARQSRPIAHVSRRLNRLRVRPDLSLESVGFAVVEAIAAGRRSLVLPRRLDPSNSYRDLPNRLNDFLLAGKETILEFP